MDCEQVPETPTVTSLLDKGFGSDVIKGILMPLHDAESPSSSTNSHVKITVVGVGHVGMAIAQTILTNDLTDELVLVDVNRDKLRGEMLDLQHAAAFLPRVKIHSSTDYDATAGSDLVVVAAGARKKPEEDVVDQLNRNVAVFKEVVPKVADNSPDAILVVVSDPVDEMTYVAWKLSRFPANRVIGSGTNLDSSRFRFLLANSLQVNAQDVEAYMIGEHGDNSVALWSSISIGGVPVLSYLKEVEHREFGEGVLERIRRFIDDSVHKVLRLKGYTSWAIGYSVADLARSLLRNLRNIHPVSVLASGCSGIPDDKEVFLSLPAQLGADGVISVVDVHLSDAEAARLRDSADALCDHQRRLDL